jgi:large subunit ribosomal protein L21
MKYSIIKTGGKQYKVSEKDTIFVDRLDLKENSQFTFPEVLLVRIDDKLYIGSPFVKEAKVIGKVQGETKGEKIRVSKFKAKVRYRRTTGFRPIYTKIIIDSIDISNKDDSSDKKSKTQPKKK